MTPRTRGLIVFGGILFVAIVFCGLIPFVVMPSVGLGVALPVIEVPGEVIVEDFFLGVNLTNTIVGTIVADILLVIFVVWAWRASKGWTREVPNRFQALVETLVEGFYNFSKGIAGDRLRTAPGLWFLVATIFFFLLAANWLKLFPGVETVGKMHCAYAGQSGYAMHVGYWSDQSYFLWNDTPLNAGTSQTAETEELCNELKKKKYIPMDGFGGTTVEEIETLNATYIALLGQVPTDAELIEQAAGDEDALHDLEEERKDAFKELVAELEGEEAELVGESTYLQAYQHVNKYVEDRLANAALVTALSGEIDSLEAQIEAVEATDSEEAESAEEGEEGEAEEAVEGEEAGENAAEAVIAAVDVDALNEQLDTLEEDANRANTQVRYPNATLVFTQDQLDTGAKPYIFHITPFVRGAATDLSLTFALAIISIVAVQAYGVWALGPAYFDKFINIPALGNLGKKPLGAIDFVVGLIEIISEIGKIVSLAFRLFGNLFAGGVALMAVSFLVALIIPGVIYGLEIIIGGVQALVFAVLTLVFSVQAMEHHGDDHDDHGDHAEAHH